MTLSGIYQAKKSQSRSICKRQLTSYHNQRGVLTQTPPYKFMKYTEKYLKHYGYCPDEFVPCLICGKQAVDIHHIIFRSQGGTDDISNLIPLCRECHDKAHHKVKPYLTKDELYKAKNANASLRQYSLR